MRARDWRLWLLLALYEASPALTSAAEQVALKIDELCTWAAERLGVPLEEVFRISAERRGRVVFAGPEEPRPTSREADHARA